MPWYICLAIGLVTAMFLTLTLCPFRLSGMISEDERKRGIQQ
jgi:hypothetical protein